MLWTIAHTTHTHTHPIQDTHVIQVPFMDNSSGFFAVYDGHGGKEAADLASVELHKFLELGVCVYNRERVQESKRHSESEMRESAHVQEGESKREGVC